MLSTKYTIHETVEDSSFLNEENISGRFVCRTISFIHSIYVRNSNLYSLGHTTCFL